MPKRGLGPRPIGLLSPETKTLYQALVDLLEPGLPLPSRAAGIDSHRAFGIEDGRSDDERIVDFDIAACYEYIDHARLADELVLQSLDPEGVAALTLLLGELFPRGIGLPQAMEPSHLLADAYLEQVVRGIARSGYIVNRFADDFRIVAPNWGAAHEAIERSVDIARQVGLVFADGKTKVRSANQIRKENAERDAALENYRSKAADELRSIDLVAVGYDDFELVAIEAEDTAIDFVALSRVVEDWVSGDREERTVHALFGARALRVLQGAPDRIDEAWLVEIAQWEPIRLLNIVTYLKSRPEHSENWLALRHLIEMPRQSPWARLWLARVADTLQPAGAVDEDAVVAWATTQLRGRYEVVRAEAAWFLAGRSRLTIDDLAALYVEASEITRAGIAACAGRLEMTRTSTLGRAIRADSALTKTAYDWGKQVAS